MTASANAPAARPSSPARVAAASGLMGGKPTASRPWPRRLGRRGGLAAEAPVPQVALLLGGEVVAADPEGGQLVAGDPLLDLGGDRVDARSEGAAGGHQVRDGQR